MRGLVATTRRRAWALSAISANDASAYPDDRPERLKEMAVEQGFLFPLCYDETQSVAKVYQAVCTPDFFLFDGRGSSSTAASSMTRGRIAARPTAAIFAPLSMRCSAGARSSRSAAECRMRDQVETGNLAHPSTRF